MFMYFDALRLHLIRRLKFASCLVVLSAGVAFAGPPKVDLLFPAGGTRGATTNVTLTGNVDAWPVQLWSSRPDVPLKALEEKGKVAVTLPAEAAPGVTWIRAYNEEGSSNLRPFIIGTLPEVEEAETNNEL